jgi:hypothetical protein
MALADYYSRGALAAAQALGGDFEESRFKQLLESTPIGLALGPEIADSREAQAIADLAIRLLARLYPTITIVAPSGAEAERERLRELALSINPKITLEDDASIGLAVGQAPAFNETIYLGAEGWDALVSSEAPRPTGNSLVPYGAGAAACFGAANIFRRVFLPGWPADKDLTFSTFDLRH